MKLLAICTFVVCAFISSYLAAMIWVGIPFVDQSKEALPPQIRMFLFIFFGLASITLPIVIAMPRTTKPSNEGVPPSADNK